MLLRVTYTRNLQNLETARSSSMKVRQRLRAPPRRLRQLLLALRGGRSCIQLDAQSNEAHGSFALGSGEQTPNQRRCCV